MKNSCLKLEKYIWLLYIGSVILRFLLANFYPKTINCYPDELLYLSLGESLWNNHSLEVFNVPTQFPQFGYSLLIAPVFASRNIHVWGSLIALINASVISIGVFPIYGLAKRILKTEKYIWLSVIFYVISPTMTYSMTYMSENLYLPIALLMIYIAYRCFESEEKKEKSIYAILLVTISSIAVVVKSISIVFVAAFAVFCVISLLISGNVKEIIFALCMTIAGVAGAIWMIRMNVIVINGTIDVSKAYYIIFGFIFFVLISVLGMCVIPIFLPLLYRDVLSKPSKKLGLYLIYLILVTAFVVSLMIYATEDYPCLTPRAHVRYVEYVFVPFLILMLEVFESEAQKVTMKSILVVCGVWGALQLFVFKGFDGRTIDHTLLFYCQLVAKEGKYFTMNRVLLMDLVIIAVVLSCLLGFQKNKMVIQKSILLGICLLALGNNMLSIYVQYKTHIHSDEETKEVESIREFVLTHMQDNFLVLEPEGYCELIDTYLIDCENVCTGMEPTTFQKVDMFKRPEKISYILVEDNVNQELGEVSVVKEYPEMGYKMYQVQHSQVNGHIF